MSDSKTSADTDSTTGTEHQAGGEFADPNATVTCTTCLAEVKPDNIGQHFNWHVDVGHHTDDAQRERADTPDASDEDESSSTED